MIATLHKCFISDELQMELTKLAEERQKAEKEYKTIVGE